MTTTPPPPAGWYPDPEGDARRRWWDGTQWTDHYEQPYVTEAPAAALRAPDGTRVETPWIWLLVVLPLVTFVPVAFIDWDGLIRGSLADPTGAAAFSLFFDPAYLATMVVSWLVIAATIVFAFLDWRALKSFGVPQPFHWAWVFFVFVVGSGAVYVIGRAIVARRRTGRGIAPMWAMIAVLVASFVIAIVITVVAIDSVMHAVTAYL